MKFFNRFDETVAFKKEVNPPISQLKRGIQNIIVKSQLERELKEREEEFDENISDIFLTDEPIHSRANGNIISFLKSVFYSVKYATEEEQLEKMKEEIKEKIEKFKDTPLYNLDDKKNELEKIQKIKAIGELTKLLDAKIEFDNTKIMNYLKHPTKGSGKSTWKKLKRQVAKSIRRPSKIQKTVFSAFKMGIHRANSRKIKDKPKALITSDKKEQLCPKSPLIERRGLSFNIISMDH